MGSERHDPTAYGEAIADDYDAMYEGVLDTSGAVDCLRHLAGGGPVLEFGVGTGRLAVPLADHGLVVHGVDSSPAMLEKLHAKPNGSLITTTVGDFSAVRLETEFSLVVLAFNTIFAMPDQDAQVAIFENAARHLATGGRFVVEAWIPDLARFDRGSAVSLRHLSTDSVAIDAATIDLAQQRMYTTQVRVDAHGVRLYPANHRYAWPAELDLMARIAGLRLAERFEDWRRRPFTASSMTHVSVYTTS